MEDDDLGVLLRGEVERQGTLLGRRAGPSSACRGRRPDRPWPSRRSGMGYRTPRENDRQGLHFVGQCIAEDLGTRRECGEHGMLSSVENLAVCRYSRGRRLLRWLFRS